jgi:D-sedoheptulose 7-phosphate isomerase
MNVISRILDEPSIARGDYVFDSDHMFFSDYSKRLTESLDEINWTEVLRLSKELLSAKNRGSRVFLCGNGGSAANANHIANDLVYAVTERTGFGFDAVSLTANSAVLTCLANDVGYENIFSEQLAVSGRENDLLLVLSGSGNSKNIFNALIMAKKMGMCTSAILGFDGGTCKGITDLPVHVEVNDMQISEDIQLVLGHMIMKWLKKELV